MVALSLASLTTLLLNKTPLTSVGDKSNHVATIHTPQMLYFWAYTAFFSIPVIFPPLLVPVFGYLPESRLKSFCKDNLLGPSNAAPPRILSTVLFLALGLASVHYNTIVHPFTLADNRHYVFYVFRILNRHPVIKYAAVPVYLFCAWLVIQSLGRTPLNKANGTHHKNSHPTITEEDKQPCQASFILVWIATTTLSLVSAPLVEPRYFIIPWMIWRVQVPYSSVSPLSQRSARRIIYDFRLPLETVWHLAINAITGYVFLYRGFTWPSEPGKMQRFLY
jgi:alpha-1,2-glucosyltransferase